MIVWRVEHRELKHGPYNVVIPTALKFKLLNAHRDLNHPSVYSDIEDKESLHAIKQMRCGTFSLASLKTWFSDFWQELKKENYVIRTFEPPKYLFGQRQVAFEECPPIGEYEITNDFN